MDINNNLTSERLKVQNNTIDLEEIFFKYFKHWRWFLLSIFVSSTIGFFYYKIQPIVYQSTATVLVKSKDDKNTSDSKLLEELGVKSGGNVDDEVEVFRSKRLLFRVVDSLNLNVSYYTKTLVGRMHELYSESPIKVSLSEHFRRTDHSRILITISPSINGSVLIEGTINKRLLSKRVKSFPVFLKDDNGLPYMKIEKLNVNLDNPVLVEIKNSKSATSSIKIESSAGKKNNVITLTTTANHSMKAIDILNQLINSYNQDAMDQINLSSVNTGTFIDGRLKFLTAELTAVEKNVEQYKKNNNFTELSAEAASYLAKTSELDKKRIENETQIRLIEFVRNFVMNEKNSFSPVPNLGLSDQGLTASLVKYNDLLQERVRIAESSSAESPVLLLLNNQITSLRKAILIGIKNVHNGLAIQLEDIKKAETQTSGLLGQIPRQEREFISIERQQKIKEQLYIFLLQKREESALTMALTVPKAIVINEAELTGQISPNRNSIMMIAFMFGLLFPIVIIYLMNLFDKKIYSRKDIEQITNLPILSEMAHAESTNNYIYSETGLDSTTELFRLLRTKLNFVLNQPEEKVILVTSTEPGEGKTFMSVNLALSLALADKKVLLVGLDLRKPQLVDKFGIVQKEGITSYLSHQEMDINSLVINSMDYPNLSILHSGIVPPNPNELLMKEELNQLFVEFRKEYDYIILDSAPVGVVSDTLLLFKFADITLYVCRSSFSSKENLEVVNRLQLDDSKNRMYLILNDLSLNHKYYRYRYRYGYGYGYGYRAKNKKD